MIAVLLALVVSQTSAQPAAAPQFDLVVLPVVQPRSIPPEFAERNAQSVGAALMAEGYQVMPGSERLAKLGRQDPAACQSNLTCFALLARSFGVPVLVRLEAGVVETDLAIFVQAVRASDGAVLSEGSFISRTDAKEEALRKVMAPFLSKLRAAFPPPVRLETPELAPPPLPPVGEVIAPAPAPEPAPSPGRSRPMWPLGVAAGGVAAAGVGAVFLANATATHEQFVGPSNPGDGPLNGAELQRRGEMQQSLGWALAGVGAAAAVTGAVLYFSSASNDAHVAVTAGPAGVYAYGVF